MKKITIFKEGITNNADRNAIRRQLEVANKNGYLQVDVVNKDGSILTVTLATLDVNDL